MEELATKFINVYANIPLSMRDEIAVVVDDKPVTWNLAYLETKNQTENYEKILEKLKLLELI